MGRTAEDLHGERRLNSARAFFQKPNELLFRFADAAKRGAETHANPIVRFFLRIFDSGVVERELGRSDRELRVTIESLESVRWKKFFGIPIVNLSGNANAEPADVKTGNWTDAGFFGEDSFPKTFNTFADASDRTEAGNDDASSIHAVTGFAGASTYCFIQRKVLLAMLPIKK